MTTSIASPIPLFGLFLDSSWGEFANRLKALRQQGDTWEADFRALPKPTTQSETHDLGMVVTRPDGFLLAEATAGRTGWRVAPRANRTPPSRPASN